MNRMLHKLFRRTEGWPPEAQEELVRLGDEIESELSGGHYRASSEEIAGIDRGLRDAAESRFASARAVEAIFARHRRE
jgi:hypothetical protein